MPEIMLYQIGGLAQNYTGHYRYAVTPGFDDKAVEASLEDGEYVDCVMTLAGHLGSEVQLLGMPARETVKDVLSDCFILRDLPGLSREHREFITAHLIEPLKTALGKVQPGAA